MKKAILVMILSAIFLSGCVSNNDYPKVTIVADYRSNYINIDIGKPYVYKGFDVESTDNGKDLILHFEEGNP